MEELIPVNPDKRTCLASDLHEFLETETRFNDWCDRYIKDPDWGFAENVDYWSFSPISDKPHLGGRPKQDYGITVGCAKEISMLQRSEKGKKARKYFIDVEEKFWTMLESQKVDPYFPTREEVKALVRAVIPVDRGNRLNSDWRVRRAIGRYIEEEKKKGRQTRLEDLL